MPIVSGVQEGHMFLNPKNHASKGMVPTSPMKGMMMAKTKKKAVKKVAAKKSY